MEKNQCQNDFRLFVGGLPGTTTVDDLRDYFEQLDVDIMRIYLKKRKMRRGDKVKVCKGYGYMVLSNLEDAHKILNFKHTFKDRILDIELAHEDDEKWLHSLYSHLHKVYINNLSPYTTDIQINEYFSAFGKVKKAYRIRDHKQQVDMPYGFIYFVDKDTVENVLQMANDKQIIIDGHVLEIKLYMKKNITFHEHRAQCVEIRGRKVFFWGSQPPGRKNYQAIGYKNTPSYSQGKDYYIDSPPAKPYIITESINTEQVWNQRLVRTESRASSIYVSERKKSQLSKKPLSAFQRKAVKIPACIPIEKESMILELIVKRNETKLAIDVITKPKNLPHLDHELENVVFRVNEKSERRVNNAVKFKEDSRRFQNPTLKDIHLFLTSEPTGHARLNKKIASSRHRYVGLPSGYDMNESKSSDQIDPRINPDANVMYNE